MNQDKSNILLVEDDRNIAHALKFNLQEDGYSVTPAFDGQQAVSLFSEKNYALIILDIMLPKMDGFEVIRKIRSSSLQVPILVLTARVAVDDRVRGLELGADDYLVKPFHLEELMLRVKGMIKRSMWYANNAETLKPFSFGSNLINFERLSAKAGKKEFSLTALETSLLSYFVRNPNKVLLKKDILVNVWNVDSKTETRTLENFIVRLRKYFEPLPGKPIYFKTIRGTGYIFTPDCRK